MRCFKTIESGCASCGRAMLRDGLFCSSCLELATPAERSSDQVAAAGDRRAALRLLRELRGVGAFNASLRRFLEGEGQRA